jgi:hypothetical protein
MPFSRSEFGCLLPTDFLIHRQLLLASGYLHLSMVIFTMGYMGSMKVNM